MGNPKHLILPVVFAVFMAFLALKLMGVLPAAIFAFAFGGGCIFYIATTWRTQFDPMKVIIPYLFTVVLFIAHVYEEYVMDFEGLVSDITGIHVLEQNFLTIAAFLAPIIWILGAIMLLKRMAFGYYFLCAFFFAMAIAELSHFIFPFLEDGTFHYTAGMYTAALPLIPAAYGLYVMMKELRRLKREKKDSFELASGA